MTVASQFDVLRMLDVDRGMKIPGFDAIDAAQALVGDDQPPEIVGADERGFVVLTWSGNGGRLLSVYVGGTIPTELIATWGDASRCAPLRDQLELSRWLMWINGERMPE